MNSKQQLVVYTEKASFEEREEALAKKVGAILSKEPGEGLSLVWKQEGLTLSGYGLSFCGNFEQMLSRVSKGRLASEMLVHAARTKKEHPFAIDATAGMGEDSFLLSAYGYQVTMYEQNPVVAALLQDALDRAKAHPQLKEIVERMHLVEGNSTILMKGSGLQPDLIYVERNSIEGMAKLMNQPDLIYLDPMFPARQKSGLVNKKLQLIQKLESPCVEEKDLFEAALSLHPGKIIVKRPQKGPFLDLRKPAYSNMGKAIRYDCYTFINK